MFLNQLEDPIMFKKSCTRLLVLRMSHYVDVASENLFQYRMRLDSRDHAPSLPILPYCLQICTSLLTIPDFYFKEPASFSVLLLVRRIATCLPKLGSCKRKFRFNILILNVSDII